MFLRVEILAITVSISNSAILEFTRYIVIVKAVYPFFLLERSYRVYKACEFHGGKTRDFLHLSLKSEHFLYNLSHYSY